MGNFKAEVGKSFYSRQTWLRRRSVSNFSLRPSHFCSRQNSQHFFSQNVGPALQSNFGIKCPFWFFLPLMTRFWERKDRESCAVTLLKPMRCSESQGKLGHKRTDMTQPMFWMSPIFSKRWSTMEVIRPKSNVLYIPDLPSHNRCMTQMLLFVLFKLKTTFECRSGGAASLPRTCQKLKCEKFP